MPTSGKEGRRRDKMGPFDGDTLTARKGYIAIAQIRQRRTSIRCCSKKGYKVDLAEQSLLPPYCFFMPNKALLQLTD